LIGLDTNVLVRYFADDESKQAAAVRELLETRLTREAPGHVNAVTLAETTWVLRRLYAADRSELERVVEGILSAPNLVVERKAVVRRALQAYAGSKSAGFSDCLIARFNDEAGCDTTLTFDRRAAKLGGFTLLA